MAVFDLDNKTVTLKLVYYGCALGGKTSNLSTLHRLTDPHGLQGMVSIATNDDRTLFFDLLPMDLGQVGGMAVKVKLYTVPGQVHYELTRRQVLRGADGIVMIVDSSPAARKSNVWAVENLRFNLKKNGLDADKTPTILQWNKRDLPDARSVAEMQEELNSRNLPSLEAIATTGVGVVETFVTALKATIAATYVKSNRPAPNPKLVEQTIDLAMAQAVAAVPLAVAAPVAPAAPATPEVMHRAEPRDFQHQFDIMAYREAQAEQGRERKTFDQESLLTESVSANMMLAEKLDEFQAIHALSERRGAMLEALSKLAPRLSESAGGARSQVMQLLLQGASRGQGSLLLLKPGEKAIQEVEVVPDGPDPLNALLAPGLGSLAYQLAQTTPALRVIEEIGGELFFGAVPHGYEGLASLLIAPITCDGQSFGTLLVYGRISDTPFDASEREYWSAATRLLGLSLHWKALRQRLFESPVS